MGPALHPAYGQESRNGPQRSLARRPTKERPSQIFKDHIRVVPYPEDDTVDLVGKLGTTDCLLMGSDWPHAEGLREPAEFYNKVEGLAEPLRKQFLRDNGMKLIAGT